MLDAGGWMLVGAISRIDRFLIKIKGGTSDDNLDAGCWRLDVSGSLFRELNGSLSKSR